VLKNAFIAEGAHAVRDNAHRMISEGIELDIIPFGGVAEGSRVFNMVNSITIHNVHAR